MKYAWITALLAVLPTVPMMIVSAESYDEFTARIDTEVRQQYEEFPYPRKPVTSNVNRIPMMRSSDLQVINQYVWDGNRDLADNTRPLRFLVAGCGTGDGVFMLAAQASAWAPHAEVIALDFSGASLNLAKKRLAAWPKKAFTVNITFVQGSILSLASMGLGKFDFINCIGVLHHVADPAAALRQLEQVLQPDGGMALMVYGKYGRQALEPMYKMAKLIQEMSGKPARDADTLKNVRWLRSVLPKYHQIHEWQGGEKDHNKHLYADDSLVDDFFHPHYVDYDLDDVLTFLAAADMKLSGFVLPAFYNPTHHSTVSAEQLASITANMSWIQQAKLAEHMSSVLGKHTVFVIKSHRESAAERDIDETTVPLLRVECAISKAVKTFEQSREIIDSGTLTFPHEYLGITSEYSWPIPPNTLKILPLLDGTHTVGEIVDKLQTQEHDDCVDRSENSLFGWLQQCIQTAPNMTAEVHMLARSLSEMGHLSLNQIKLPQGAKVPLNNQKPKCQRFNVT